MITNDSVMVNYKGFDKDFQCRGYQYEIGGEYWCDGSVKTCYQGFHACEYPLNVFSYYAPAYSRYAIVEQSGHLDKQYSKIASSHIKLVREITLSDLTKAAIDYTTSRAKLVKGAASAKLVKGAASAKLVKGAASATGDRSAASATGDQGAASATGYQGAASATGYHGAASATGDRSAASATGDQGAASATGYQGAASATGDHGAASATGYHGAASATGYHGAANATGDQGAASATGYHGAANATGDHGAASATGYQGAASATGYQGRALAAKGNAIFLAERDLNTGNILHAWAGIAGYDGIRADTWYTLQNGKPAEVK